MGNRIFKSTTIEECLEAASAQLNIPVEKLVYSVIEERKSFFKKTASISVQVEEKPQEDGKNGTVKIENGKIIVKNPIEGRLPAEVIPSNNVKLYVDGEEIKTRHKVLEESSIEVIFDQAEAKRLLNVSVSQDKMEASIDIEYKPQLVYGLKEQNEGRNAVIEAEIKEEIYPPAFTVGEIKEELNKIGIKHGIIEENITKSVENRTVNKFIAAEGTHVIDDIDDRLELKFNTTGNHNGYVEDKAGRVDYKNVGAVNAVKKGDVLAVKVSGQEGSDGKDVYGKVIKKKERRRINLKVGGGCILKGQDTIEAVIDGKPCIKNNVFYVYQVHEVQEDVDIKTGNIQFIGDVKIHGNVKEGMKVEAGNSIDIAKNVESAGITAKGNISIRGNVIMSSVAAGGEDLLTLRLMNSLLEMKSILMSMNEAIMEIKRFNLLGNKTTDGEIIKILIENKYKGLLKLSLGIIRDCALSSDGQQDEVAALIKGKLIGTAPLGIKHFSELDTVLEAVNTRMALLEEQLALPVNVNITYCQDSTVTSSGDIFCQGKGMYVSKLTAHKGIYFLNDGSIARGGSVEANTEIKCKIVGSPGGVSTKLCVGKEGHIWADIAYPNSIFVVGGKEFVLEKPSKNVHAYLDKSGELTIDKLSL